MAKCKFHFALLLIASVLQFVNCSLVRINHGISVPIGRTVHVDKTRLAFTRVNMMETCKVEVVNNEPMTQRVGKFEPQVFDCEYFAGSVHYSHSGSPFLSHDKVKLRVFHLTSTSTFEETLYFNITIQNDTYNIIQPKQHLLVTSLNGLSNPIDSSVITFNYSKSVGSFCNVQMRTITTNFPGFGQLITNQQSGNPERIRTINLQCDDFLQLGIRYEHLVPPTPNLDFVPITVEVSDINSSDEPVEETYYLPVDIEAAYPNQPPTALHMSMYLLEVDQFILTTIASSILSAEDDETDNDELVFEVVSELNMSQGYITHLDDQSQPIMSFTLNDVHMLNIAYKPPNTSYPERRNFEMNFIVYDSYFATSKPINIMFSVRNSITNAPRVIINKGLSLLEGQSRMISSDHLQIVDNDDISRVRIKVMGGLMHGQLYKGDTAVVMFTPSDILDGLITYQHDDSDSESDSIVLRVSDIRHSVQTTFPINILPKDDTAPYLIHNVQFNLPEGGALRITKDLLLASDVDSPNDFILFKVMHPPTVGEILKKFSPQAFGYPVNEFTQRDLHQGRIYYSHLGKEAFEDTFSFVLLDNQIPPNISPMQIAMIKIEPIDDLPPYLVTGTMLGITVRETEIGMITQQHMRYTDTESSDEELLYSITTQPYFVDTYSLTDAGRIISTSEMVVAFKDAHHQSITSFRQEEIDHLRIAYMPPFKELGPQTRTVQFIYSVHDKHGNTVLGQIFNITILPVNNQAPIILCNDIMVREGDTTSIDHLMLAVTDMDTERSEIVLRVTDLPHHGSLQLNRIPLATGAVLSIHNIRQRQFRYVHDGSETLRDSFTISANDGIHTTTKDLMVIIAPINDEVPRVIAGLITELTLHEGEDIILTTEVLSATDVDTYDMLLKYIIISSPSAGVILKNDNAVSKFTQMDINNGRIRYRHTAGEIGLHPLEDSVTFVISDKILPSVETLPLLDVHFNILPVDNQPPAIVLGNPYFVDEGQRATINMNSLSAIDRDTLPKDISFIITQNPVWGYVENVLPDPGSEKSNVGKPITHFTFEDLIRSNINYVQFRHEGVEPVTDFFMLHATDGVRISANISFPVTIMAQNDEAPSLFVTNFSLYEGSFYKLSSKFFFATDTDVPMDMLMFSIIRAPRHGIIFDRAVTNLRSALEEGSPIYDFNLNQLLNTLKLTYLHDGSESTTDMFIVRVTDGKHVIKKTVNITIHLVNDQHPALMKNTGFVIGMHESRIISSVALLAFDADTPDDHLYYVITTQPRRGNLLVLDNNNNWRVNNGNFSQHDLNMNRVKYNHTSDLGSKGIDRIRFVVTDGEFSTSVEGFKIEITNTKKQTLAVSNNGAHVLEGDFVVISTNLLSADDSSNLMDEIIFTILTPPTEGQIEYISQPGKYVSSFTQMDLTGGLVIYSHRQVSRVHNDQFNFMVSNGQWSKNDTFYIVVEDVDNKLPELVSLEPVTMANHGTVIISSRHLGVRDGDTTVNRIIYTVTQPPLFGQLLIDALPVRQFFTQADIDNLKISYKHIHGHPDMDEFFFIISDGTNIGYTINGVVFYQPQRFSIEIIRTDDVPPRVTTMEVPLNIELKNGFYGYVINRGQLEAVDDESTPIQITYTIVVQPVHGHLENTKTRRSISNEFTQKDINDLNVVFVLKENVRAVNDSFTFDVHDGNGNTLTSQRFEFKWAILQFAQPDIVVCETIGVLPVHIIRSGYVHQSSFIQVTVREIDASVGLDFIPSASKMIQFDPGVTMGTWLVEIIQDDLEENRERFRVLLQEPVNAILGEYQRQSIVIKDAKNGICNGKHDGSIVIGTRAVMPFGRESIPFPEGIPPSDCDTVDCGGVPGAFGCLNECDNPEGCQGGCNPAGFPVVPVKSTGGCISDCLDPEDIPADADHVSLTFEGPSGQSLHSQLRIPGFQVPKQKQGQRPSVVLPIIPKEYLAKGIFEEGGGCGGAHRCDSPECVGCEDRDCDGCVGTPVDGQFHGIGDALNENREVDGSKGKTHQQTGQTSSLLSGTMLQRDSPETSASPQKPCSQDNTGELFLASSMLYECNGEAWIKWEFAQQDTTQSCEEGWSSFNGKCYHLSSMEKTWNEGQQTCREQYNGNLVTIQSKEDQKWIQKLLSGQGTWIGVNDKFVEGQWEWVSQDPVMFTRWKNNEPQSSKHKNCAYLLSRMRWVARGCSKLKAKFICETHL